MPCKGTELHLAAVRGDLLAANAALRNKPDLLNSRFTYQNQTNVKETGRIREGSGQALHLAASRGFVEMAKMLLDARAEITSMVFRDQKPDYDVLHAATLAEGRGGSVEMLRTLLDAKAGMTANLEGVFPIHKAFETGCVPVINYLRQHLREICMTDADFKRDDVPLPLSLGIAAGRMSEDQLSEAAELTTLSLTTFIDECPQCIPPFLQRFDAEVHISAMELARNLTRMDIAKVLRAQPEAALALLRQATEEPICDSPGWHPLPTRVSFANRSWGEYIKDVFNTPKSYLTYYQRDHMWKYDSVGFEAPLWHSDLMDRDFGRPIRDAEIKVCHVPDLLCAEVFSALCDSSNSDALFLYEDDVIRASVQHVFWHGCWKVDLTRVLLTLWGLALLIAEEVVLGLRKDDGEYHMHSSQTRTGKGRRLHSSGDRSGGFNVSSWLGNGVLDHMQQDRDDSWVAISWIGARGLIDLWQEYIQFKGFWNIGRPSDYLAIDNLADTITSCLPMFLFFNPKNMPVLIFAVIMYWIRLLHCFTTTAEYIGLELLPIIRLAAGLGPATGVTLIAFGAFMHSFYLVDGHNHHLWPDIILESFTTLITGAIPEVDTEGPQSDNLRLVLILVAVLFFSVFILNIFIGVMGELYLKEKTRASLTFWQLQANSCFQYLLRCRVLPCRLMSQMHGLLLMIMASVVAVVVQVVCMYDHTYRGITVSIIFGVCQASILIGAYQDPDRSWVKYAHAPDEDAYIWYCKPRPKETEDRLVQDMNNVLNDMDETLSNMKDRRET